MVTFTRFLLLNLHLLSYVYASEESTSEAVKWLEAGRSVLVYLATPDLYFCMSIYPEAFNMSWLLSRHWTPHASNMILLISLLPSSSLLKQS